MQQTMDSTVNSIHFLWAAYILVVVANVVFALWVASMWARLSKTKR
jgi:hypothetical protein